MAKSYDLDYAEVRSFFLRPLNVVITTHRSPDGDAIGSSIALYTLLKKLGHSVDVVVPDAFPSFLNWMEGISNILVYEENPELVAQSVHKADAIFSLDYNRLERVAGLGELIDLAAAHKLLIDHHIDPDDSFDFILSDTQASSTCELIYRFANELGWLELIDKPIAEALYAGIMTDTGSFKFSSTSAQTHRITANLIETGMVPERVHSQIFDTNSFERLKLLGYALSKKLEVMQGKGVSIIALSRAEKNRFKYKKGDTEGLVNYGLSIKNTRMAVFLSEELDFTKLSFRSKGEVNVNEIARMYFNGGGHKNAAGGRLDLKLNEALNYLYDVIENKIIL